VPRAVGGAPRERHQRWRFPAGSVYPFSFPTSHSSSPLVKVRPRAIPSLRPPERLSPSRASFALHVSFLLLFALAGDAVRGDPGQACAALQEGVCAYGGAQQGPRGAVHLPLRRGLPGGRPQHGHLRGAGKTDRIRPCWGWEACRRSVSHLFVYHSSRDLPDDNIGKNARRECADQRSRPLPSYARPRLFVFPCFVCPLLSYPPP